MVVTGYTSARSGEEGWERENRENMRHVMEELSVLRNTNNNGTMVYHFQ